MTREARIAAYLTALAALVVYVGRLCPTLVLEGDSAEIVTASATWGVPHAPGFPLFTALGHLMTKLPAGEIAWRVHLGSATFHAATAFVVVVLAAELTRSTLAAVFAGAVLVLSRAFFAASLYAEVFPLNDLFFAILLWLAHRVNAARTDRDARRWLLHTAWVFGLAVAHHPMILFGAPGLLVLSGPALWRSVRAQPRVLASLGGAATLALAASYALVPIAASRNPSPSFGEVHDVAALVRLVLRLDYGGPLHAALHEPAHPDVALRVAHWSASIARSMSFLPIVAVAGLVVQARARATRRQATALAAALLLPGPGFAAMNAHFQAVDEGHVAIAERFTTMAMIPLALAAGLGLHELVAWALSRSSRTKLVRWSAGVAVAGVVVWLGAGVRSIDLSANRRGIAYARDLLRPTSDDAVVLVAGDLAAPAALYLCEVEHACANRIVFAPGLLSMPWYGGQVRRRYPALAGLPGLPRVAELHRLVDALVDVRPVFVMPSIMTKDPALEQLEVTPALLLFRLSRKGAASRGPHADVLTMGEAMTSGDDARCGGCRLDSRGVMHPSMTSTLVREYAIALENHAVVARELGAIDLAVRLEQGSRALLVE